MTVAELMATLKDFDDRLTRYDGELKLAERNFGFRKPAALEALRKGLSVTWGEISGNVRALGAPLTFVFNNQEVLTFENALRPLSGSVAAITTAALPFARHAIELARGRAQALAKRGPSPVATAQGQPAARPSNRVFVVHGHDSSLTNEVAAFVGNLGLEVVILKDKPNAGRTLIEKFEDYADVSYAVVLLTPDDVGRPAAAIASSTLVPRARQNVILEWGFFMGKKGRDRVAVLYKGGVEKPSDIGGIAYVPADDEGWKLELVRELKHAGFSVKLA